MRLQWVSMKRTTQSKKRRRTYAFRYISQNLSIIRHRYDKIHNLRRFDQHADEERATRYQKNHLNEEKGKQKGG